jgi:methyl-accepting chemotaxis protein
MHMDQTTQQNAALVEETTAASQSMRAQAQALMKQVKSFKVNVSEAQKAAMAPVADLRANTAKTIHAFFGEPEQSTDSSRTRPSKEERRDQPVGVAAGAGQERRRMDEKFEEF